MLKNGVATIPLNNQIRVTQRNVDNNVTILAIGDGCRKPNDKCGNKN